MSTDQHASIMHDRNPSRATRFSIKSSVASWKQSREFVIGSLAHITNMRRKQIAITMSFWWRKTQNSTTNKQACKRGGEESANIMKKDIYCMWIERKCTFEGEFWENSDVWFSRSSRAAILQLYFVATIMSGAISRDFAHFCCLCMCYSSTLTSTIRTLCIGCTVSSGRR